MPSGAQLEALVTVARNLIAFFTIHSNATYVGHEDARLARNIGTEVPRVAGLRREHRVLRDVVDVGYPLILSLSSRLNGLSAALIEVRNTPSDPVDVLFDGDDHIAQNRWRSRPGNRKQVWETSYL